MMTNPVVTCELCDTSGGEVLLHNALLRVVLVDDADYPGFCRVILNHHVAEMTDMTAEDREALMQMVWWVESVVREVMAPAKINLASLGNVVPHVHWHVIPRYLGDVHFPAPVWAAALRLPDHDALEARRALLPLLREKMILPEA